MSHRPPPVTVAAVLLVLLSLTDFPFLWWYFFHDEEPQAFVFYTGIVVGIVGLVVTVGLWLLKAWSFWSTIIVSVFNLLLGAPGVIIAPTAALRVAILVTEVVAALVIVLVVLPSSRHALLSRAVSSESKYFR